MNLKLKHLVNITFEALPVSNKAISTITAVEELFMVVYLHVPVVVNLSVDYVFPSTLTTTEIHLQLLTKE